MHSTRYGTVLYCTALCCAPCFPVLYYVLNSYSTVLCATLPCCVPCALYCIVLYHTHEIHLKRLKAKRRCRGFIVEFVPPGRDPLGSCLILAFASARLAGRAPRDPPPLLPRSRSTRPRARRAWRRRTSLSAMDLAETARSASYLRRFVLPLLAGDCLLAIVFRFFVLEIRIL